MKQILLILLFLIIIIPQANAIDQPILKWEYGGCYSSWCETGWYSAVAVADLDDDGTMEIIASAYSIVVLDGITGEVEWRVKSGHDLTEPDASNVGRTWPNIIVLDVDNDGELEIITAHSGGYVSVYSYDGYFESGWPQQPTSNELRGLDVYDLDNDGTMEIIVTGAVYNTTNTWVYEHDGTLRPGWPQLDNDTGCAYGIFNDNAAVGDLDGDGYGEIVVPSDVHYICAYEADGEHIQAHSMYEDKVWGEVGIWESLEVELRGWGNCDGDRDESYRTNFAHGAALIDDVNDDGINEVIAIGNVYNCQVGHPPGKYNGVYIFNADRSRFNTDGYDWQTFPLDTGAPLSEDYNIIESNQPNPITADIDNDGNKEIIFSSYDGFVHSFWLDKTEHHNWPFAVYDASEGFYRFASEPLAIDLDNDNYKEIIFCSWVQKETYETGKLHILNYLGTPLYEIDLPDAYDSSNWNGALPAPVIANIDDDIEWEIILNTAHSGVVTYDLPNTTEIENELDNISMSFKLHNNYPNPFNPNTTIKYELSKADNIHLAIYNIKGQLIKVLVDEKQDMGYYDIIWDGTDENGEELASGLYIYQLISDEHTENKKMLLLK